MTIKDIVATIKNSFPNISSVYFVGCGASQADLYVAKYFLIRNAKRLRTDLITANEFNYDPPKNLGSESIVVACSLGGTTPELEAAVKIERKSSWLVLC